MCPQWLRSAHFPLALWSVVLVLSSSQGSLARQPRCKAHSVSPSFQSAGSAPNGIFTLGQFAILVDDAADGRAILACRLGDAGFYIVKRSPLPNNFTTQSIALEGPNMVLTSIDGERYAKNIAAMIGEPSEALRAAKPIAPDGFEFSSESGAGGSLRLFIPSPRSSGEAKQKNDLTFELRPIQSGAEIFTRKVLALDAASGTATIYWDEIGERTRAFIIVVDRAGAILRGVEIPIDKLETVPERFVGVTSDGRAYYLSVKGGESVPVPLPLDPNFKTKSLEKAVLESRTPSVHAQPSDDGFQEAVRKNTGDSRPKTEAAALFVSRASVVECAKEFSILKWTMTRGAYEHQGVTNVCDPQAKYWLRPFYLKDTIGKAISGVPYCWGCSDSLERFLARVAEGSHLAGHSCTCREGHYCLRTDVVGVDCSGLVSQCWKSGYYQTSRMSEIADPIDKRNLKPGDALNLAGSHIRLFLSFLPTSNGTKFKVIEATNSKGSIGRVIENTYTAAQLNSYQAIRYRKITD
jgi:hypothetical protein